MNSQIRGRHDVGATEDFGISPPENGCGAPVSLTFFPSSTFLHESDSKEGVSSGSTPQVCKVELPDSARLLSSE